jgi:hypothetical protein
MDLDTRDDVRRAVGLALQYWPNAHLGTRTRRDDMRSAFKMLRSWTRHYGAIQPAIGEVERSAYSCMDM